MPLYSSIDDPHLRYFALFGVVLAQLSLINCKKNIETGLLELQQTAAMTPQADLLLINFTRRPLKNS